MKKRERVGGVRVERLVFHQTWVEVGTPEQTRSEGGELSDVWEAGLTELREGVAEQPGKGMYQG